MPDDSMSDEDKALFHEHMQMVKPLSGQTLRTKTQPPVLPKQPSKKIPDNAVKQKEYFLSDFISTTVDSDTTLSYSTSNIPTKRLRELRTGQIPLEARLDLHGLKAEAARKELGEFIQRQTHNNKRCVLIIHGKGGHLGAPPVIKNLVNRWLPQFDDVLAFHSAQPKDGGHGALYVLLKKQKEFPGEWE